MSPSSLVRNLGVSPHFSLVLISPPNCALLFPSHTPLSFSLFFFLHYGCRDRWRFLIKKSHHFYSIFQNITYLDFCSSVSLGLPAFGLIYSSEIKTDHILYSCGSKTNSRPPHMVLKAVSSPILLSSCLSFCSLTCILCICYT